ncbi:MAG: MgtC/SapB family protein [Bacteroidales bacterium]|nr:MgtC/SapB family protein [Bacteroidales bacterium]
MSDYISQLLAESQITPVTATLRLLLGLILGLCIGLERQVRRHDAGLRTFTLICLGSTCAVVISIWIPQAYPDMLNGDPGRIAAQVLAGVGFIGAGAIVKSRGGVQGLTSAACIWQTAIVGMTAGAGLYLAAVVMTAMTLFVLIVMDRFEHLARIGGDNLILTIILSTPTPDKETIETLVSATGARLREQSIVADANMGTSIVTYRLMLTSHTSQIDVIRALSPLSEIKKVTITA